MDIQDERIRYATWMLDPERVYSICFEIEGKHSQKSVVERTKRHYGIVTAEEFFVFYLEKEKVTMVSVIWPIFGNVEVTDIWPEIKYWLDKTFKDGK